MSERIPALEPLPPTQTGLVCRLRSRELRRGPSPTAGEFVLENKSPGVVEIEVSASPLQYLNLVVLDANGTIVSESLYGDIFSPLLEPYLLQLGPNEKYIGPVSFLGNVPEKNRQPGKYSVQAVYEYKDLRVISEPFEVKLPEPT